MVLLVPLLVLNHSVREVCSTVSLRVGPGGAVLALAVSGIGIHRDRVEGISGILKVGDLGLRPVLRAFTRGRPCLESAGEFTCSGKSFSRS